MKLHIWHRDRGEKMTVNKQKVQNLNRMRSFTMVLVFIILAFFLHILTKGLFLTERNISNLVRQMATTSILAAGVFFPIVTKNIDMSVGSMMGLLGGICALSQLKWGFGVVGSIAFVVVIGILLGIFQGILIAYADIPAFIATLGGYLAWRGVLYLITGSKAVSVTNQAFVSIGRANLRQELGWALAALVAAGFVVSTLMRQKARIRNGLEPLPKWKTAVRIAASVIISFGIVWYLNRYEGLPIPFLIMLAVVALFGFIAEKTTYGRSVYAIGGSMEAARYSGIPVKRNVMLAFAISGSLAAVASVVLTARINSATPSAGVMGEMDAIAAAVIGGASLSGGVGKVSGVIIGALIMSSIDNGMSLMNVDSSWQYVIKGIVLVGAVFIDVIGNKKSS
ncbi:MAG: sugar ABC transporter permease [[Clostridium] scindens]|jgi:D-xylose transport system permease protein